VWDVALSCTIWPYLSMCSSIWSKMGVTRRRRFEIYYFFQDDFNYYYPPPMVHNTQTFKTCRKLHE